MCGLEVDVEGDRVVAVRPDADDVWSRGFVCPKGAMLGALHHDPDRLRAPLVREGERWREVGWDEAFARCAELLRGVLDRHGKQAVTAYVGNPTAHGIRRGSAGMRCVRNRRRVLAADDPDGASTS
jgi:anaerobic selenocysteine-containing dehydrogenase